MADAKTKVEPTEAQIEAAAECMWNDRDARMGGAWQDRGADEVCVMQTKATAKAAIIAAYSVVSQPAGEANERAMRLEVALREARDKIAADYGPVDASTAYESAWSDHDALAVCRQIDAALDAKPEAETPGPVAWQVNLPDALHQYAVTSTNYGRPFLLGCYETLDQALKAQGGKPEKWDIFVRYATPPADALAARAERDHHKK